MIYYLKKHWGINVLIAILQVAWAGVDVMTNVIMMRVGQSVIDLDFQQFLFWTIIDIGLWTGFCLLDGLRTWAKCKATMVMNNHVRADIVATMLRKNHREFHAQQSGEYLSWLTNDVNQIAGLAWESFYAFISLGAKIIFSITALAQMHWSLMAFSLVVAVIMIYIPKLFEKKVEALSEVCAKEQAQAMSKLKDLLAGFDVLRFFARTKRFADGNREASEQLERPVYKRNYTQAFIGEGIDLVNTLCQAALNTVIGILSIKGVIIQSALLGGGNLCGTIYGGLASFSQYRLSLHASKPYFDKITVHADKDMIKNASDIPALKDGISVEHLGFRYGEKPILVDTNMRFEKGGKYALTGPSGCGKSTLLKLLLGWLPEYTGKITFDGQNAKNFTSEQLQQQMSYIEQDVFLFNTTIRDNITLGENYSEAMIARAIKGSALDHDLANMPLGLDTPVGEDGSNLSGGQKQRVAIARALLHNRSILLVDEGTSALDQKNADIVEQSLLNNPDLTLILISHHLSEERKKQFTKVYEMEPVSYIASPKEVATV